MAQTKRKRRRKRRGTQSGRVDVRPRGRPRNRAEAKSRARSRGRSRGVSQPGPPTWSGAIKKGIVAALIFFALIAVAFGRPPGAAAALAVFMLAFYIPMAYFSDRFFYNRRVRREQKERLVRAGRGD